MEDLYISPWIKSSNPVIDESGYSEVVLTRLNNGITLPAKWDGSTWLFQDIKDYQLSFIPLSEVNVVDWMYIPN